MPLRVLRTRLHRIVGEERGASAVEYGFLAVFIAAIIVVLVMGMGGKVSSEYSSVNGLIP